MDNAGEAIEFYKRAFGATERGRMEGPGGTIAHAEVARQTPSSCSSIRFRSRSCRRRREIGGTAVNIFMYVEDVDAVVKQAEEAGATVTMPPENMFWGDRFGTVSDPYGHHWALATRVKEVSPEEMEKRGREAMASMAAG